MDNKNIRHTEKYITISAWFNNTLKLSQEIYDKASYDKLVTTSAFYQDALDFYKEVQDISLLIFALPGLILRAKLDDIMKIYGELAEKICQNWDNYLPNFTVTDEYLFLRLQDIHKLDSMYLFIAEFIYFSKEQKYNVKKLLDDNQDDEILLMFRKQQHIMFAIDKLLTVVYTNINKIYIFVKKVINSIDDTEIQSTFVANSITLNNIANIISNLERYKDKLTTNVEQHMKDQIITRQDTVCMNSTQDHQMIAKIIDSIRLLDIKQNHHILVLGLKYVVKNFDISNKLMMEKMLNDTNYSKVVSIILDEFSNK